MSYDWQIGMEVECIKNSTRKITDLGFPFFKKGERYTIAGFHTDPVYGLFLSFAECDRRQLGHEAGFRPIVKRKTSIEIFTRMLNPQKQDVDA